MLECSLADLQARLWLLEIAWIIFPLSTNSAIRGEACLLLPIGLAYAPALSSHVATCLQVASISSAHFLCCCVAGCLTTSARLGNSDRVDINWLSLVLMSRLADRHALVWLLEMGDSIFPNRAILFFIDRLAACSLL